MDSELLEEARRLADPEWRQPFAPPTGDPSTDLAIALLGAAASSGVQDVVVCPGSRSQALALVAAELERVGRIRLHVRHDERGAGFFALGLARESRRPVPVIVTSGTAVANLHPAMLEARHARVPLVALTADRPPELIGIAANQATRQDGIFGPLIPTHQLGPLETAGEEELREAIAVGWAVAWSETAAHVNVAFRDPLSTAIPPLDDLRGLDGHRFMPIGSVPWFPAPIDDVPTIVIAGADASDDAETTARSLGVPLIAEVASGARFGRHLVTGYRELLGERSPVPELRDAIGRIVVYGHPTLSRQLPALIADPRIEAIVVDGPGEPVGRDREGLTRVAPGQWMVPWQMPEGADEEEIRLANRRWLGAWARASRELAEARSSDAAAPDLDAARSDDRAERAAFARGELAVGRAPVTREMLVDAVWRATWPHDRLVVGASRLIRDLDERAPGKAIRVHANRGLAGIDGTIATALGVAYASQHRDLDDPYLDDEEGDEDPDWDDEDRLRALAAVGTTRVLLGDLSFLHDASSLLVGQGGEEAPRVQIVVGNDGGGKIFDSLEVAETAGDAFERVLFAPQQADLGAIARAYGWAHAVARTRAELDAALIDRSAERVVIEVPLER